MMIQAPAFLNDKDMERFIKSYEVLESECWIWKQKLLDRAGTFRYTNNVGAKVQITASRVSYQIKYGRLPPKIRIGHNCFNQGDDLCVNPDHLEINAGDVVRYAKLTKEQVIEIRELEGDPNITVRWLAAKYNVSLGAISNIINKKSWKNI